MIKADRVVTTTCPYCGVGCNLQLHVKDDFIYKVTSPFDSPVNHGNLCVKGRFGYDYIYHPKRVTTTLVRRYLLEGSNQMAVTSDQWRSRSDAPELGNRSLMTDNLSLTPWDWVETDWDTALNITADKLVEIYKRDGSEAMSGVCCAKATNEDNYLLQKMWRGVCRAKQSYTC